MASLDDPKHQDADYEQIALDQAKNGDVVRALRNADMIKSDDQKAAVKHRMTETLASSGFTDDAIKMLSDADDRPRLEIVKKWLPRRSAEAITLAGTIKDPYFFAQAALAIGENCKK